MMRTLLKRGFSQRSQMEVELLVAAWMLPGGNGGGRMGGDGAITHAGIILYCVVIIDISISDNICFINGSYFYQQACLCFPSTPQLHRPSA